MLISIGAGLVAMTGGGLIGSLLEGLGSLFGAKSPMEKVTDFAKGLEDVDMTKIVDLGNAFEKLQNAEGAIMLFSNVDAKSKRSKTICRRYRRTNFRTNQIRTRCS